MRFQLDTLYARRLYKLVLSFLSGKPGEELPALAGIDQWLSLPYLDAENEKLFWLERQTDSLRSLQWALLLGGSGFLAFVLLDVIHIGVSDWALTARMLVIIGLFGLFIRLQLHPEPSRQITFTVRLGVGLAIAALAIAVLTPGNHQYYPEIWSGLLPLYFFLYGQLFLTITEALLAGGLSILVVLFATLLFGTETAMVLPAILLLLIVNLFGFCTRKQMEIHSRQAFLSRRKVETAFREKNQFLRQLSHNLRQPLQALSCYCTVLDASCTQMGSCQKVIGKLGYAIDELSNAFNYILHLSHTETGKPQVQLRAVNINNLLTSLEFRYAPLAAKRGLKLMVLRRDNPPFDVFTDPCVLNQVIGNLLDNAIKYTRSGWILVSVVKISGDRLKLHVLDTGIGITEQEKQHIFKEFYRSSRCRSDLHIQGSGIGLAYVSKALQNLPEHALKFYSKINVGSDFQLYLPVASNLVSKWDGENSNSSIVGCFIFLVDDDVLVREALAGQLSSFGCLVQTAASIAEAQTQMTENIRSPDLLITDFYLQNQETGLDIINVCQQIWGAVPTLIFSAHDMPEKEMLKWPENTRRLRKPATAAQLLEIITEALGR
jgi:signal transduction histidine kinase/CheY-like chemotaxis protein